MPGLRDDRLPKVAWFRDGFQQSEMARYYIWSLLSTERCTQKVCMTDVVYLRQDGGGYHRQNKPAFRCGVLYKGLVFLRGTRPSNGHCSEWRRAGFGKNQPAGGLYTEGSDKHRLIMLGACMRASCPVRVLHI